MISMFEFEEFNPNSSANFRREVVEKKFLRATEAVNKSELPTVLPENETSVSSVENVEQFVVLPPPVVSSLKGGCFDALVKLPQDLRMLRAIYRNL